MSEVEEDTDSYRPSHSHSHGHSHSHDAMGDWEILATHPLLKFIVGFLAIGAAVTVIGIVALWPQNENRDEIATRANQAGLAYDLYSAEVESAEEELCSYATEQDPQRCVTVIVTPAGGSAADQLLVLSEYNLQQIGVPDLEPGQSIVVGYVPTQDFYIFIDIERRVPIVALTLFFIIVVLALARKRGAYALLSMASTVIILVGFIGPSILNGNDPLLVAIVGASLIAFSSLYLTHGVSPTTTVALAGTLSALLITLFVSKVFFEWAGFTGYASDASASLGTVFPGVSISSVLLAGAVLGALGALDDITVTQVATISELHERNPKLTVRQLFTSGIKIGREHIASTVNTLLLAYAGASLPLLMLSSAKLTNDQLDQPAPILSNDLGPLSTIYRFFEQQLNVANSEEIAVEVVRTLCGSIGLVAAVPATTILAAVLVGTSAKREAEELSREEADAKVSDDSKEIDSPA